MKRLYQEGIIIKFKNKEHILGYKGEFDPSVLEILIYKPSITSKYDEDITILHELLHAKYEVIDNISNELETDELEKKLKKKQLRLIKKDFIFYNL